MDDLQNVQTLSIVDMVNQVSGDQVIRTSMKLSAWKRHIMYIAYHLSPNECLTFFIDTSLNKKLHHK